LHNLKSIANLNFRFWFKLVNIFLLVYFINKKRALDFGLFFERRTTTCGSTECCSSLKEEGRLEIAPRPTSSKASKRRRNWKNAHFFHSYVRNVGA